MKSLLAISEDVDLTRDFVRAAYMACADIADDQRRPAMKSLLYHVEVLLDDIERDLGTAARAAKEPS